LKVSEVEALFLLSLPQLYKKKNNKGDSNDLESSIKVILSQLPYKAPKEDLVLPYYESRFIRNG